MKVSIHDFDYGTKIVSFGNYYEYDDYLACAITNTNITVTHLDVKYDSYYNCFDLYPRGQITCGCCKKEKDICLKRPAYAMHFRNKRFGKLVYQSLLCNDCRYRVGKYASMAHIGLTKLLTFGGSPGISRDDAQMLVNRKICDLHDEVNHHFKG